ncbi:Protein CBG27544 [Caenorhabditis briggsae]|uniref:Uncharacterized protein n=2 Tax=Caenorhabditis briggsae TaxID=6238 RepID=A0AAE9CTK7_CAEBR|nr:Protein CBG27544 [Caenorhabditis briggsae]ULT81034.1 hypothetical protein L3Y34_011123 [Caenorhabditis briggsae]UMM40326.1 hypothetical protein L5515_017002 [Caenorhabditis briggsae]CAS00435.1 Protein CBG27544 [Caenorhabditis briggsae]
MSHEPSIRNFVARELELSKLICQQKKRQMTYVYYSIRLKAREIFARDVVEKMDEEFHQHNTMFELTVAEEDDLVEYKRLTVCMTLFTDYMIILAFIIHVDAFFTTFLGL